jgi:hypothetical protein
MVRIQLLVEVEVEHTEGKFASRDDIGEKIADALEAGDEGTWYSDEDAQYDTVDFEVRVLDPAEAKRVAL